MDSPRWREARALFEEIVDLAPGERAAALATVGPDVRAEVESLLAADASPLSRRLTGSEAAELAAGFVGLDAAPPGTRLGSYRVVRVIASGGMGTVYEAEQDSPRRAVALKTVRQGFANAEAERRFRYESEVLARLRHPGIAQIHESGVVPAAAGGRPIPFFAMEFVEGAKSILDHARDESLSLRERLDLFLRVCDAVRHAHEKGVIHRDLKPGNILVDASGQPKIIDFGVARLTEMGDGSDTATRSLVTRAGEIVGTLQYMSPEQFSGEPGDVDTLSDVYALGVVLYELLTGKLPHDLGRKPITEMARIVREEPPASPSAIAPELAGDLEWILLKALERDKPRRYASAADLAEDLRRHLRDEPVSAGPPSRFYRFAKFVRRHRLAVGAASLVFLAIVAGVAGTLTGLVRARDREREAKEALARAEKETAKKTNVNEFFRDMLRSVDPTNSGPDAKVKDVLDGAAASIEGSFEKDPEIEAEIRGTIGNAYLGLGLYDEAEPHLRAAAAALEKVRGEGHIETIMAQSNLANVYLWTERLDEAEAEWRRLLDVSRRSQGEDSRMTITLLSNLSVVLRNAGRPTDAEPISRDALERSVRALGEADPDTLVSYANLAVVLDELGKLDEAEAVARRAVDVCRRELGAENVETVHATSSLAGVLGRRGNFEAAVPLHREAIEGARRVLGPTHPETLAMMTTYCTALRYLKRFDEAEAVAREQVAGYEAGGGADDPNALVARMSLSSIARDRGRNPEALDALGDLPERAARAYGEADPRVAEIRGLRATILVELNRLADAETDFREALVIVRRFPIEGRNANTAYSLQLGLGDCLRRSGRFDEAEPELLAAREGLRQLFGAAHPSVIVSAKRLVQLYEAAGRPEEAAKWRGAGEQ